MKNVKNIEAVIFDLDGVITETSTLHTKAWKKMTAEENIPFDEETADKLRGVSRKRSLEIIIEDAKNKHGVSRQFSKEEFNELMERKNNYYVESLSEITPEDTFPGVMELIDFLKNKNYKIAIGSSSKNAEAVIKNLEIENLLDATVNGTEITHSKPHPEIFRKAADKLGIPYEKCMVVEDAASGVESANAGEMISVGIGPAERFRGENEIPDYRFENMQSFNANKEEIFD